MRWAIVSLVLGAAGCDRVLGLQRNPPDAPPAPDAAFCVATGLPGDDDDGDSIINSADRCPQVANQSDADDEDADTAPDACDPCPQLVGDLAGNDPDCDGLGAACDPQPMAFNSRRFHGFVGQIGYELQDTVIEAGAARMEVTNTNGTSELIVSDPARLPARLEAQVTIKNARVEQYWSFDIVLLSGPARIEIELEKHETTHTLNIVNKLDATRLGMKTLGALPAGSNDITFQIKTDVAMTSIETTIVIDGVGSTSLATEALVPRPEVKYGFSLNRDANPTVTSTTGVTPFFIFTTLAP